MSKGTCKMPAPGPTQVQAKCQHLISCHMLGQGNEIFGESDARGRVAIFGESDAQGRAEQTKQAEQTEQTEQTCGVGKILTHWRTGRT